MNKHPNHDYANLQLLDYGLNKSMTSIQNFVDLMTRQGLKGIYSVHNIRSIDLGMSLELPNATSIKFFG